MKYMALGLLLLLCACNSKPKVPVDDSSAVQQAPSPVVQQSYTVVAQRYAGKYVVVRAPDGSMLTLHCRAVVWFGKQGDQTEDQYNYGDENDCHVPKPGDTLLLELWQDNTYVRHDADGKGEDDYEIARPSSSN